MDTRSAGGRKNRTDRRNEKEKREQKNNRQMLRYYVVVSYVSKNDITVHNIREHSLYYTSA